MNEPRESRYQTHPYLRERWDAVGRALAFRATTVDELAAWREALRKRLKELTGYDTMREAPLDPVITQETDQSEYLRQRVEIQTEPGVIMPLFALIPKSGTPPFPVVLCPHGHGSGGKQAVVGLREVPEVAAAIEQFNYDYAVQFVRAGFVALAPDARGFGERQENIAKHNIMTSSCQWINNMAYPLGQTVTGMWAWDLHRLVDYARTRPDCDKDRIGCAGLSGGGLQTLWVSALDERIRCTVISGYFYGYKESLLDLHGNCSCNYVPHLYEVADIGDVGALIAPRPVLIETGDQDPLNGASGLGNVLPQVETLRRAYAVLGATDAVHHDVFEGGHRWHGTAAIPWMRRWLGQ